MGLFTWPLFPYGGFTRFWWQDLLVLTVQVVEQIDLCPSAIKIPWALVSVSYLFAFVVWGLRFTPQESDGKIRALPRDADLGDHRRQEFRSEVGIALFEDSYNRMSSPKMDDNHLIATSLKASLISLSARPILSPRKEIVHGSSAFLVHGGFPESL